VLVKKLKYILIRRQGLSLRTQCFWEEKTLVGWSFYIENDGSLTRKGYGDNVPLRIGWP
jgi:hypothetical protein